MCYSNAKNLCESINDWFRSLFSPYPVATIVGAIHRVDQRLRGVAGRTPTGSRRSPASRSPASGTVRCSRRVRADHLKLDVGTPRQIRAATVQEDILFTRMPVVIAVHLSIKLLDLDLGHRSHLARSRINNNSVVLQFGVT